MGTCRSRVAIYVTFKVTLHHRGETQQQEACPKLSSGWGASLIWGTQETFCHRDRKISGPRGEGAGEGESARAWRPESLPLGDQPAWTAVPLWPSVVPLPSLPPGTAQRQPPAGLLDR